MADELLVIFLAVSYLFVSGVASRNLTIENKCNYDVWPVVTSSSATIFISPSAFVLRKGEARVVNAPSSWTGRVWGRAFCSTNSTGSFSCASGDCGTGKVECSGAGSITAATLVEFTLDSVGGKDFYDVSVIDGYNLPVLVHPQGGDKTCSSTGCVVDLNVTCPFELRVTTNTSLVACMNACQKLKLPEYCCEGDYASPDKCKPSLYAQNFKSVCPRAYTYTYDDSSSTSLTCASKPNYAITFCPSTILNTTK